VNPVLKMAAATAAAVIGAVLAGCGGALPPEAKSPEPVALGIHVPCVLSGPMQKVVAAYESRRGEVEISVLVDKPMAMLDSVPAARDRAGVAITLGENEMQVLVDAGAVQPEDVVDFAVNTYPMVVVAAADAIPEVTDVAGLALPQVRAVAVEDPAKSSLGDRSEQALRTMGLWQEVGPKIVRLEPNAMVLGELIDGSADAAVIFRDCLFGESGGNPPKTIRIIGELSDEGLPSITYQAAALADTPDREEAQAFVRFLVSPEGRQALVTVGLNENVE
jgi:molybdate transport system substrate-binding protein